MQGCRCSPETGAAACPSTRSWASLLNALDLSPGMRGGGAEGEEGREERRREGGARKEGTSDCTN